MTNSQSGSVYLFVYGTLLARAGHAMGRLLREQADLIGTGRLPGRLYLVEERTGPGGTERPVHYPACVPSDIPGETVHGEVYALRDHGVLAALDAYEECGPEYPEPQEYVRRAAHVSLKGDRSILAWVYLYNRPVEGLKRIASGIWTLQP